ncbi:YitT family protein [Paenibacillus psychroresistens]|uniref:YitT family protein n=1 Tax=Paenibacillus psychroresistens TaxID=1778678 RepID=A0A6B8RM20_9BACL|nr:YitT family protein [Paenibacillus psychroresistens]QGQ97451.1 YitT family protein [Paenibacillus psychroresistens]
MKRFFEIVVVVLGAAFIAVSFNLFLIPHQLLSGGLSGVAMIVGYFTNWNIGLIYFISNLPVLVWGIIAIGRKFIILSVISVIFTVWFMQIIPVDSISFKFDQTISAVFGGVLLGIGSGITLRIGGSSGGFDIIGSILTRKHDFPLGSFLLALNSIVVFALGYFKEDWNLALYSMLSMFIVSRVMDTIHIRHLKVTAFIITEQKELITKRLLNLPRGVTLIKTAGAYSNQEKDMLMTVITRYELAEFKAIIKECDPKAFVNIVETTTVIGEFRKLKS